jgi:hypothetical protein
MICFIRTARIAPAKQNTAFATLPGIYRGLFAAGYSCAPYTELKLPNMLTKASDTALFSDGVLRTFPVQAKIRAIVLPEKKW